MTSIASVDNKAKVQTLVLHHRKIIFLYKMFTINVIYIKQLNSIFQMFEALAYSVGVTFRALLTSFSFYRRKC